MNHTVMQIRLKDYKAKRRRLPMEYTDNIRNKEQCTKIEN